MKTVYMPWQEGLVGDGLTKIVKALGFKLFLRGHNTEHLLTMNMVLGDCLWWENQTEQSNEDVEVTPNA